MARDWEETVEAAVELGYQLIRDAQVAYSYGSRARAETAHVAAELQYTRALMCLMKATKRHPEMRCANPKLARLWENLQNLARNGSPAERGNRSGVRG